MRGNRFRKGPAAVARIREDVVNDQRAAGADPLGPAVVVLARGLLAVAAVDEQQLQRRAPALGHHGRLADHRHHVVVQRGLVERVPQRREACRNAR